MRIDRPDKPIPYLNKRDRRRLMFQVALLCLVIMAIVKAANPDTWRGFLNAIEQAGQQAKTPRKEPDLRVQTDPKLNPGEFHSQAPDGKTDGNDDRQKSEPKSPEAVEAKTEAKTSEAKTPDAKTDVVADEKKPTPDDEWPLDELDVPAKFVEMIKDRTLRIRAPEARSYYRILTRAGQLDPKDAADKAIKAAGWLVLMDEPDFHRGKLVSVRGELRSLTSVKTNAEKFGVDTLYEAWIFPKERPQDPYHVFVTEIPKGIPEGQLLKEGVPVTVVGYFFKLEGYGTDASKSAGVHVAPLILARTLGWKKPVPPPIPKESNVTAYLLVAASGLFLVVIVIAIRHRKSDAAFKSGQLKQATTPPDEAIAALNQIEGKELEEQLRDLAKDES